MGYIDDLVESYNRHEGDAIDEIDDLNYSTQSLTEAEYNRLVRHLKFDILDIEKLIKVNELKEITTPRLYSNTNMHDEDGLLSDKIFGITQEDRSGTFAYIDLGGWFIDPSCYKCWIRLNRFIKPIVHKESKYRIDEKGDIVEDPNGENGIEFLRKNINKIRFTNKENPSIKRDLKVKYLERNRKKMFISKYPVIPPYYRDTNTSGRSIGVGGINELYTHLLIYVGAAKQTQEYGFDMSGPMYGRIQESLLNLYDMACGNTSKVNSVKDDNGSGLSGKMGFIHRANMSKTTSYGVRLVMVGSELKANTYQDMMVNFQHSSLPLAATIACFKPFIHFYLKRFFENEFLGRETYQYIDKDGKEVFGTPVDPMITFSDERIKMEMDKYIYGYNTRFSPIPVPIKESENPVYMVFKGEYGNSVQDTILKRRLTWCDLLYMAAVAETRDKMVLITRYPVDTKFNEFTCSIVVDSTKEKEQLYINGVYYPYYPKIREEDINTNTGNRFIDTMRLSNLYLEGLNGDYDGDTVSVKGVFANEANDELRKYQYNKANFLDLGARNKRKSSADVIQSTYQFTKVLEKDKELISSPVF